MNIAAIESNEGKTGADFLVASYDGIHLLFYEREVRSVEMIEDLMLSSPGTSGAFLYRHDEMECPVYALDREFSILQTIPAQRQHFVLLTSESGNFGIACDQTTLLRKAETRLIPLPECMQYPTSPVQGLALIADAVGFYCPSSRLAARLFPERE